jgi:HAD superfamily hydrolase (TIGR01549 family)
MIKAITFDFWDTIVFDDSDEPKRAALGLPSKAVARRQLLTAEIQRHQPEITAEQITAAFDHCNQRFNHCWKVEHHTPTVADRLRLAYDYLQITPGEGFTAVVNAIEEMELEIAPDFLPGVHDALAALASQYKLAIISDAIHTPGRNLRRLLDSQNLGQYFTCFVFSDEAGAAKPSPLVFEQAAACLGVALNQIVHVGDRESNDVTGPQAMGMKAIFFTGALDRGSATSRAEAVCGEFAALLGTIGVISKQ